MQPSITSELLWGFAVGAASVSTLTVTADKLGSKIAGALGGVPSTVASSLFFLALARSPKHAAEATHVIPLAMGFYGLLLTLYCSTVRLGVVKALVIALSLWSALSLYPIYYGAPSFGISLTVFGVLLIICYGITEFVLHLPSEKRKDVQLTITQVAVRMLIGGTVVSASIFLGANAGPTLGGLMAAFPAVTITTIAVAYQNGGAAQSAALAKSIMMSGMINVTAYALAVRYFFPLIGPYWGTCVAFLVVMCTGPATFLLLIRQNPFRRTS